HPQNPVAAKQQQQSQEDENPHDQTRSPQHPEARLRSATNTHLEAPPSEAHARHLSTTRLRRPAPSALVRLSYLRRKPKHRERRTTGRDERRSPSGAGSSDCGTVPGFPVRIL